MKKQELERIDSQGLLLRLHCRECQKPTCLIWNFEYHDDRLYFCPHCQRTTLTYATYYGDEDCRHDSR